MPNATTATETLTYLVVTEVDERSYIREYVEATSDEEALALVQQKIDAHPETRGKGEVAAKAQPLQPILDRVIERREEGVNYALSFKHEDGSYGPVWITDLDAQRVEAEKQNAIREDGTIVMTVPFGHEPDYTTTLPWMRKAEAKRLAKYLGIPYGES